ncbi:MAG TPA: hypothetical protein VGT03_06895 [Candidatus Acidoferrales bacterium]|nr:hypothetical protein [Candidatus Acidoferrales bacterium]
MRVRARSSDDAHIPVAFGPANDSGQLCARLKAASTKPESHGAIHVANSGAPLRRRSWQQLGRVREIEDARAARRERESDTDTFPAPSNIVVRN